MEARPGIKFARFIKDKFSHDKHWSRKTEYVTDIDVDYRKDLFDRPPSIKDGAAGWKQCRAGGRCKSGGGPGDLKSIPSL